MNKPTEKHQVATTANGQRVFIDLMQPPTSVIIARNPHLLNLIKEILERAEVTLDSLDLTCDLKRTVGYTETVASKDEDVVFYAREAKAEAFTRFVKNRQTAPTSIVSLRLKRSGPDQYTVIRVRLGKFSPPLPGSGSENAMSQSFWAKHAVVYNGQSIMASSVTKQCPYPSAETAAAAPVAA